MIKLLVFIFTINIFGISSTIDSIFNEFSNKKNIKTIFKNKKVKSLVGTWITDTHITIEIIIEGRFYIGIVKSDPYDSTSTFLNGESVLRINKNLSGVNKGRLKIYNDNKSDKEWIDANFKISNDTIFDGYNLYKKVLDSKLIIKRKRLNKKNIQLRVQASKQLKSSDWKQRFEGVNTIVKLNDYSTIPQLTPLLFDKNDSVRKATYFLLKKFNEEKDIAGLPQLLKASRKLSNSRKLKINNTTLDGIWKSENGLLQIYLGTDNTITITTNSKTEKGLYISDGENQLAVQLDSDSKQIMLEFEIKGDILSLKSPHYKNKILLKKLQ